MGLSNAVLWWEEWQLRILVLGSLFIQYLLLFLAPIRKLALPSWLRSIIWLAYVASDSLSIYALAALFNRQTKQDCNSTQVNSILEVVWAPVLLMHLGGQDCITAYNIEDNELWTRHVLTAVSQITVAIYVFCKSWRGSDKRLLQASILLFIPGVLKCLEKPWALKRASINNLVNSSSDPALRMTSEVGEIKTLQDYVLEATSAHAESHDNHDAQEQGDALVDTKDKMLTCLSKHTYQHILQPWHLFVDLASSYPDRLSVLKFFRTLSEKEVYLLLQDGLSNMFDLLYSKDTFFSEFSGPLQNPWQVNCGGLIRMLSVCLSFTAIGLFHSSHREAYNTYDVKITYILFCCTAVLELYSVAFRSLLDSLTTSVKETIERVFWVTRLLPAFMEASSPTVAQYSLVGFFARNRRQAKRMRILRLIKFKDFLDQRWSFKTSGLHFVTIKVVYEYVNNGWQDQIKDVASYWKFNDHRGQGTLQRNHCNHLCWSSMLPFDESVLLWHMATDFCFYLMGTSADHQCATAQCIQDVPGEGHGCVVLRGSSPYYKRVVRCREMSNYMMYLLFVNPEMLLPGTRRNLFTAANAELEKILKDDNPSLKAILKGDKPSLVEILTCNKPFLKFFTEKRPSLKETEREFMQRIITKMQVTKYRGQVVEHTNTPPSGKRYATTQEGYISDAWKLANGLLNIGDESNMWEVIEGVWVEMLCFSASRCRGYLHAKSLGTGGELLTNIWLLLSYMGMETLPERLQRTDLSSGEANAGATLLTSQIHDMENPTCFGRSRSH